MARRPTLANLLIFLVAMQSLSGCLGGMSGAQNEVEESNPFGFDKPIPSNVWYHYKGGIDATDQEAVSAANLTANLSGNNLPFWTDGTYYGIGFSTFEPTIGITSADNLFITSWGNGPAGSTAIVRCSGLIEMENISDYTCVDTYDPLLPVPNSNDPYVYVDKWTDRIMKFDMHALLGMTVEWSDNEGESWSQPPTVATSIYSVQDHQTITSAPYPAPLHETTWVFCINGNAPHPLCSTSFDGGATWSPEVSGAPLNCQSGGLTAHLEGSPDGNFYRGNTGCSGDGYSIYRSTNGGFTWTEHPLPTEESGTADTWNAEEAQVAIDDEGNVHAMWMGIDDMPYYAYSKDEGNTWSDAMMVAPPIIAKTSGDDTNNGTGFPVITAGSEGRVALGYVATYDNGLNWHGYITIATDTFSENPLFTTVQINSVNDPLENAKADCGYDRCGGLGDFLDMSVDQYGRPWFGLSHNVADIGIFATITDGPKLRGDISALNSMPLGGNVTL